MDPRFREGGPVLWGNDEILVRLGLCVCIVITVSTMRSRGGFAGRDNPLEMFTANRQPELLSRDDSEFPVFGSQRQLRGSIFTAIDAMTGKM